MGQDLTVVFVPAHVDATVLESLVSAVYGSPDNLALLIADETLDRLDLRRHFDHYTCLSLWSSDELNMSLFAAALSRTIPERVLALTMCDHSCVGGWEIYDRGELMDHFWTDSSDGGDYTTCGVAGFAAAYGAELVLAETDRNFLIDLLVEPTRGMCLASTSATFQQGQMLTVTECQAIREDDVPGVILECCLAYGPN